MRILPFWLCAQKGTCAGQMVSTSDVLDPYLDPITKLERENRANRADVEYRCNPAVFTMDSYKIEANNGEPDDWPETWREMSVSMQGDCF